jgi:hypothetical protein
VDEWNKIFGESTTVQYASNWTAIVRPDRSQNDNDIVQYASNVYSNHWQIEIALLPLLVLGWGIVVVAWITVTAAEIAALFAATLWVAYLHQNPQVVPEALATVSQRNHAMITESSRQASCELENIGYELSEMAVDWASCLAWGDWSEWLTCWFEWAMNAFFVILPTWCSWPIISENGKDSTNMNTEVNVTLMAWKNSGKVFIKQSIDQLSNKIIWFSGKFKSNGRYKEDSLTITSPQATKLADELWYDKTSYLSNREPVYKSRNNKRSKDLMYITIDVWSGRENLRGAHHWWMWKAASDPRKFNNRSWTYSANLTRISD